MTPTPKSSSIHAKICGIRTLEAARAAVAGGADYLGFVFYPPSRRAITPDEAGAIVRALRADGAACGMVGLFDNADPAEIEATVASVGLDIIQLSGHEPPAALTALDRPVLKTIHLSAGSDPTAVLATLDAYLAAAAHLPSWPHGERLTFLLDATVPGQYGGTGQTADWELAAHLAARRPCGLAGGLDPTNVATAIAQVRPWLVDVSGGVETDGAKDPGKIRAFLAAVTTVVIGASDIMDTQNGGAMAHGPDTLDDLINQHITPDPDGMADRARLAGSGVPVWAIIAYLQGVGGDVDRTAADYEVERAAVEAAVRYYQQHRAVIDARITLNAAAFAADGPVGA
jgi:phosphoribosylanthranilate isomerase